MYYEIWLGLNIVYETLRPNLIWVAALGLAWLALLVWVVRSRQAQWKRTMPSTLVLGAVVAILALLLTPTLTGSGLGEVRYIVDWMFLGSIALGAGVLAGLGAWPMLAWRLRRP